MSVHLHTAKKEKRWKMKEKFFEVCIEVLTLHVHL